MGCSTCCNSRKQIQEITIVNPASYLERLVKIQSHIRGYRIRKKYGRGMKKQLSIKDNSQRQFDSTSSQNAFSQHVKEVGFDYDTKTLEENEKIKDLKRFLPKFELDEKEKYIICTSKLQKTGLLYSDGSIYKGTINAAGKREGYGKLFIPNGSIYEGFFQDNKMQGRGRMINIDGYVYEGEFFNSKASGYGKLISNDGTIYKGNWKNDKQNGMGYQKYKDQSYYMGNFVNGIKCGKGTMFFKDGSIYEGEFIDNEIKGEGIRNLKDGRIFCGMWSHNKMNGYGIFVWPDKKKFVGHYTDDVKDGFGAFYWNNGKKYEGFWKKGKQNGFGVLISSDNNEETQYGEWKNGANVNMFTDANSIEEIKNLIENEKGCLEYQQFSKKISTYEERIELELKKCK